MGLGADHGEVGIDTTAKGRFRNAFQSLVVMASFNVGTLLARA
jgi:hypothetical protein